MTTFQTTTLRFRDGKIQLAPKCTRFLSWSVQNNVAIVHCLFMDDAQTSGCKFIFVKPGGTIPDGYGWDPIPRQGPDGTWWLLLSDCILAGQF